MFIFEGPGEQENNQGRPMVGKTGEEYTHLLRRIGLPRERIYTTNVVKCRVPNNGDPTEEQVQACLPWLVEEIQQVKPSIIVLGGAVAIRALFNDDLPVEMLHGIPFQTGEFKLDIPDYNPIIIPIYHPSAGLHRPDILKWIHEDFKAVADTLRRNLVPRKELYNDRMSGSPGYYGPDAKGKRLSMTQQLGGGPYICAIDTEWARSKPWCLTISGHLGESYMIMATERELLKALNFTLNSEDTLAILHNSLYDLPVLAQMGVHPPRFVDTMFMAYMLGDHQALKTLAFRIAGMKMSNYTDMVGQATYLKTMEYFARAVEREWPDPEPEAIWQNDGTVHVKQPQNIRQKIARALQDNYFKGADPYERWKKMVGREIVENVMGSLVPGELCDINFEDAKDYACADADATLRIYPHLDSGIRDMGLDRALDVDMSMVPMAVDMMKNGMPADPDHFYKLAGQFQARMREIEAELREVTGVYINPGSSDEVRKLLFKHLKLPRPRRKTKVKKEDSTDDKTLSQMAGAHPAVGLLKDWRQYKKLESTYANKMPMWVQEDGKIHANIRGTRTATGRLSTFNPNLMAQPVRSQEGRDIRNGYHSSEGCSLVGIDYSQLELRVLAHESQDREMIDTFLNDGDIHETTGMRIFGLPADQLDDYEHRRPSKVVNFGIPYGITAIGMQESIGRDGGDITMWTEDRCQEFIEEWFKAYPGVKSYMAAIHAYARRYGYVKDFMGGVRYIPGARSYSKYLVAQALREAGNHPIQGGAGRIIKKAMGDLVPVYRDLNNAGYTVRPLLQIHDELLWEIADDDLDFVIPIICSFMEFAVELSVPTPVDPEVGKKWGELKTWKGDW